MQHLWTILIAIFVFGLIIGIHEFGHFLAAKLNGIQVNEFSIGMGPKLLQKQKGEPLIGVTIILKNDSTVHSLTDMNGNYSIMVPTRKSVLSFRYIGFVPKEEIVDNRKVVNVQMVEDVGQLDEVV